MTLISHRPAAGTSTVQWTAVQPGLWVAKVNGEFAGMIESVPGEGYSASSRLAQTRGTFESLDAAKASFS